jgi:UDP-2,4-diacetamido-2,4,6-trideoxy-beta-L-altropyranose hydrolase
MPDWLVVDHYAIGANWESTVRPSVRRIMAIDDLAVRAHDCDLLLDQTYGRKSGDYEGLVPAACVQLLGPAYALLRPEFARAREIALRRRREGLARRILVTMGGVDLPNMTTRVLRALSDAGLPEGWRVDVVLGPDAPSLNQVREESAVAEVPMTLHVGTTEMARLMASSDFAIGAAGSTVWERCCLGLPGILFVLAANQQKIAAELVAAGCGLSGSFDGTTGAISLKESVAQMLKTDVLDVMSQRASEICDGMGTTRVGMRMLHEQEHYRTR